MTLNDVCEFIVDCPHSTAKDEAWIPGTQHYEILVRESETR